MAARNGIRWSQQDIAEAIRLRKRGRSLNEISAVLGPSKGTLHRWLADVTVPAAARRRLLTREVTGSRQGTATILKKSAERREETKLEALADWERWCHEPLFMLGIGLYWGEGDKTLLKFAISNSDEDVHRVFMRWIKRHAPKLRLRASLAVHRRVQVPTATAYWRAVIGNISISTSIVNSVSSKGKQPKRKLPYGTLKLYVRTGATRLALKMATWINLARRCPTGESNPASSD